MSRWNRRLAESLVVLAVTAGMLSASEDPGSSVGTLADLAIEVVGLESGVGQVRIAVFDSAESWLESAVRSTVVDLQSPECRWIVDGLPEGEYGIAVLHDLNENGKNDRNLLGMPKEPYGFSNGARAALGPPRWAKSKFRVSAPSTNVQIVVK